MALIVQSAFEPGSDTVFTRSKCFPVSRVISADTFLPSAGESPFSLLSILDLVATIFPSSRIRIAFGLFKVIFAFVHLFASKYTPR